MNYDLTRMATSDSSSNGPRIWVGTSGFSYNEWKGIFYPEKLPSKKYLAFYAEHFHTTEINNTFYRMPTPKLIEGWREQAPANFTFTLKLSQKITHFKRLRNVDDEMAFFLETAGGLKQQLGAVLVQLPPNFKKDAPLLGEFLARFAPGQRLALEFRHQSWFCDEIYELLRAHSSALAIVEAETEGIDVPTEVTAPFVYMRLRKGDYTPAEMNRWARWIRNSPVEVFCYLKHDDRAPVLANELLAALGRV